MSIDNLFSSRLRQAMTMRGVKQVELCEKTGIPKSALSQYLRGSFEPKQDRLMSLAKALDVTEAWLMGYEVTMERKSEHISTEDDPLYAEIKEMLTPENIEEVKLFLAVIAERERQKKAKGK